MEILYKDEDAELYIEWCETLNGYLLHTTIHKWSLSKYKKYLIILGREINKIKEKEVFAIPLTEQDEKWERLFGFKDTGMRVYNYKIMRLSWD